MSGALSIIGDLHTMATLPKTNLAERGVKAEKRFAIHEDWMARSTQNQGVILKELLDAAVAGKLSPDETAKKTAQSRNFRKKGVGSAINWLSSVLDLASLETRAAWYEQLSDGQRETAEAIRCRKPWVGIIDPLSLPLVDFFKNRRSIGCLSKDDAQRITAPTKIGIVGNGLTAQLIGFFLNHLSSRRFEIHYLESTDKIGGRMDSHIREGAILEGGAMRIPKSGKNIHQALKSVGIGLPGEETIPFPNMGEVPGKLLYKGEVIDWPVGASAPDHPKLKDLVNKFERFSARLRQPLEKARAAHDLAEVKKAWQRYVDCYSGMSVRTMLAQGCAFSEDDIKAFANIGLGTGGLKSYLERNVSALELAREITADLTKGQGLLLRGARDAVERLGKKSVRRSDGSFGSLNEIAQRKVNSRVKKVSYNGKVASVEFHDAARPSEDFDFVFVTPHAGAAKHIDLSGVVPKEMAEAIEHCDMMGSTKLIVPSDVFWEDEDGSLRDGMVRALQSDEDGMNSAYFVSYPGADGKKQGVVYLDYRWATNEGTTEENVAAAMQVIKKMVPEMARHLEVTVDAKNVLSVDWDSNAGGAFRELSADHDHYHQTLAKALDYDRFSQFELFGKVVPVAVASADSLIGGYSDTAAIEAIRAAQLLVRHVGGTVHEDMPVFHEYYQYGQRAKPDAIADLQG